MTVGELRRLLAGMDEACPVSFCVDNVGGDPFESCVGPIEGGALRIIDSWQNGKLARSHVELILYPRESKPALPGRPVE